MSEPDPALVRRADVLLTADVQLAPDLSLTRAFKAAIRALPAAACDACAKREAFPEPGRPLTVEERQALDTPAGINMLLAHARHREAIASARLDGDTHVDLPTTNEVEVIAAAMGRDAPEPKCDHAAHFPPGGACPACAAGGA